MNGVSRFSWEYGISFNEGGTPFNFCILWGRRPWFFYVYLFGKKFHSSPKAFTHEHGATG